MSINALQLVAKFGVDTSEAQTGLAAIRGMLGPGGGLALGVAAVGASIAAIGITSLKMAGDFQAGMTTLVTGAGESKANLGMVSDGILQMARDTGTTTKQLTDGMFMVESAGFHGAAGLDILRNAAMGAKVGNADLGTTADALTTILKDYPHVTNGAAGAMNTLIATVAQGKTHMEDLAGSLSAVLPTASAAGVGLNDVMGAMATMTGEGVPAANAATYLRQTILALDAPSKQAKKTLAEFGLTTSEVSDAMKKSLPDAMQMITDAVGKKFPVGSAQYVAALKDISGGSKTMQGMLDLTGAHMGDFQTATAGVSDQVKKGGKSISGWTDVQGTFNFQVSRAKEVAETLMIQLGTKLLPVATALFGFIADKAVPALTNFVTWVSGSSTSSTVFKAVLAGVAIAIVASLVPAFVGWAIAAGAAAIATIAATWPVLAIGAAIGLLILGVKALIDHWKQITTWLGNTQFIKDAGQVFSNLGSTVQAVGKGLGTAIKGGLNDVIGALNGFIGLLDGIQIHIPAVGVGPVHSPAFDWGGVGIPKIPLLAQGGVITSPGDVIVGDAGPERLSLPAGARVEPLSGRSSGGGGEPMIIQWIMDGRLMAQIVTKYQPGVIRQATGVRGM